MSSKKTKYFFLFITLSLIFLSLFIIACYFMGIFNSVKITREIRGPYIMVYMPHKGAYHLVQDKIEKVGKILDEKKIPKTIPCALFHDDPKDVAIENLKSEGGYLVDKALAIPLKHPFGQQEIPQREVIVASIKAHPFIAPFKTYASIVEFMRRHSLDHNGPSLERYLPDGIVEVEMPFRSPNMERLRNSLEGGSFLPKKFHKKGKGI